MKQVGTDTNTLLGQVIASTGGSEFEAALSTWLRTVLAYDNVTMMAYCARRAPQVFLAEAGQSLVFERLDSVYVTGAYLLDPFYDLHRKSAPEGLYRLVDVAPDQFQRNEYFATYYGRTTLIDEIAFVAHPASQVTVTICLGRDASSGRKFSAADLATARDLAPVVNALAGRHWVGLDGCADTSDGDEADHLRARLLAEKNIALSPRQGQVAFLILQGHSSISIGLTLGISPQTVKVMRKQLYAKCAISSQAQLFALMVPYLAG